MHAWMMMDGGRLVMLRVAEEQAGGWELPVSLQMVRSGALLVRTRCPISAKPISGVGPPH